MTTTFTLQAFQNEFLAQGADEVDAIVTIEASGATAGGAPDSAEAGAEVIMVDVSGSMEGTKLRKAREATIAAIDCIRDGVRFGVIAGNHSAMPLYPTLVVASSNTKAEAAAAVRRLKAGGGTAIGEWIKAATALLSGEPGVRHAILLTDGKDEHEAPPALQAALEGAHGVFQCDCRGVGTDWVVAELRTVANALLGTVDIVADPSHLSEDFQAMMQAAMGKSVADVRLQVWTPQGAEVLFVKQVSPDLQDLTETRQVVNPLTGDYPIGSWGNESRDYHVSVKVRPGEVGDEMLAARVKVIVDGESAGQALVRATWTGDTELSTRINRQVAHYTGQQELAELIQDGLEARKSGDEDTAIVKLGKAVAIASQSGNTDMAGLLANVVDVDAATGRVKLKRAVSEADEMTLETRSTRTARVRK